MTDASNQPSPENFKAMGQLCGVSFAPSGVSEGRWGIVPLAPCAVASSPGFEPARRVRDRAGRTSRRGRA